MSTPLLKYRIPVSVNFPSGHIKQGQATHFPANIYNGTKRHTIRANYTYWHTRIHKIQSGLAQLHLYTWSGKPYRSKANTFIVLHTVNIQTLIITPEWQCTVNGKPIPLSIIAQNDGLSVADFKSWFRKGPFNQELAIIHFDDFLY